MEDRDNMVPDPPLPRVPDRPMEPQETPLQDLAREVDSLDPMRADRLERRAINMIPDAALEERLAKLNADPDAFRGWPSPVEGLPPELRMIPPAGNSDEVSKRLGSLPKGCVVAQRYPRGELQIFVPAAEYDRACRERDLALAKTFTTQAVPFMVHLALRRAVSDVLDSIPGKVHSHTAVMIHPRDWGWYLEYLRQQGTLDEKTGPIGSLEIEGITVLQDVGGKVPHLELRAE